MTNKKIRRIVLRVKLRRQGKTEEYIDNVLRENGLLEEKQEIKEDFKEDSLKNPLKIYCFDCKCKQYLNNGEIRKKEIKKGSYRRFLRGNCVKCSRNIVGIVKNE